jgi:hypothetical protein
MNSEVLTVLIAFITAVIGYYLGAWKSFTDQKLKTYVESLPVLSKVAFSPDNENTKEFNRIIMEMWLYGSKKVVKKMDTLIYI